jgi:DNA repair exonuclease SbcCD ATPase subunit
MILFKKIRWKNFLSTGNEFTEIDLSRSHSTILLGVSGSGKSTFLDAIAFVLFSKPFRNINRTQLINTVNQKNLLVEIEFSIGKNNYFIRRGIKPNIFEIYKNSELINQDSHNKDYQEQLEQQILKFNFKAFSQIVVLGASNFTPFMQLKPADRRVIIEGLLDIEIFSTMNVLLKEKLSKLKDELNSIEYRISLAREKLIMHQKYLEDISKDKEEKIRTNLAILSDNEKKISDLQKEIDLHNNEISNKKDQISFKLDIEHKLQEIRTVLSKLEDKKKNLSKELVFYKEHSECPTCKQDINDDFRNKQIDFKNKEMSEITEGIGSAATLIENFNAKLKEALVIENEIKQLTLLINQKNSSIYAIRQFMQKIAQDTIDLKKEASNISQDFSQDEVEKELHDNESAKSDIIETKSVYEVASLLLKDSGVKSKIIKQYLPLINKFTNKFLSAMNFYVTFTLDEEFNEYIKFDGKEAFSYANFSEGEKQRIDLALLFTWRTIAKLKNSVNTNLLVLDEVLDSYLDTTATENVLSMLKQDMFKDSNIFVISHKDKFDNRIKFIKSKNFSSIE